MTFHGKTSSGSSGCSSWYWWRHGIHQVWRQQQKPWEKPEAVRGRDLFFRFYGSESRMILMGHKCPHWDLYKCPMKQPKRKSWDKHLGRVSFGFNCFSHLGQDSQHLLCKKKRSHFLAVKSTKKLMEFLWSCRLTNMLWVKIHIWTFSVKKSNKHCSKNICSKGGHEKFNFLRSRKQTNMTMKKNNFQ